MFICVDSNDTVVFADTLTGAWTQYQNDIGDDAVENCRFFEITKEIEVEIKVVPVETVCAVKKGK